MRKRLRKKLHLGEFQELGFTVSWQFTPSLDASDLDTFFDALLHVIEGMGLAFGGGGGPEEGSGFLCRKGRGSVSEKDRLTLVEWFDALGPNVAVTVGPYEDAWHEQPQFTSVRDWIKRDAPRIILPR